VTEGEDKPQKYPLAFNQLYFDNFDKVDFAIPP